MTLVYRLPGPRTTRSALRSAAMACGRGRGAAGVSQTRRGRRSAAVIVLSPADLVAALELRVQHHVVERGRQHAAPYLEDLGGLLDGAFEVAGDLGQGGHEEVAEAVALEAAVVGEAVLEQAAHDRLVVGQGHEAVAQVARRRHAHVAAQQPRAAAVVGHRHHGGEVAGVRLETAEKRGKTVAAAHGHDARAARQPPGGADLAGRLGTGTFEEPGPTRPDGQRDGAEDDGVERQEHRRPMPVLQPAHAQAARELRRPETPTAKIAA